MKFEVKESNNLWDLDSWKSINKNVYVAISPAYIPNKKGKLEYAYHILLIARGENIPANRKCFGMNEGNIIKGVKYEKWDDRGHFTGNVIGNYTIKDGLYVVDIDLSNAE
jgi:hypothetical protein